MVAAIVISLGTAIIALVAAWGYYADAKWEEGWFGDRPGKHRPERIGTSAGRVVVFGRGFGQRSYHRPTGVCAGKLAGNLFGGC